MDINHATPEMTCLHRYSLDSTFILLVICGSIGLSAQQSGVPQVKQSSQPRIVKPVGEEEVKLFCNVKEAVSYTWYKNGKVIPAAFDRYTLKKYRYLRIVDVVKSDSGLFVCVASNGYGSANCTINFLVEDSTIKPNCTNITGEKPKFASLDLMRKTKKELRAGDEVELTCLADGEPTPIVTWYKDGKIYERSHDGQRPGPYDYQLVFNWLEIGDSGSYMCNVSNALGFLTFTYNLTVQVNSQPNILLIWEQRSPLYVGQNVEIFCTIVTFDPNTKYRWYHSDTNIWNEEKMGILIDPRLYEQPAFNGGNQEIPHVKFTLTLQNVTIDQSGLYGCRAENRIGHESRHTNLTVTHRCNIIPPVFADTSAEALTELPAGHSVMLKCKADGAAPLKYTWLKDGKILRGRKLDPYLNTSIWYLKLKDLVPGDAGEYTCIVSNPYGSISHTYSVRVQDNPLDPKDTGSESDDPVIMDKVSWILLGVSLAVFVAMVTAAAWLCMKMWKLKMSSRANARGSRHDVAPLRPRYDVQNEYVVVPNFN